MVPKHRRSFQQSLAAVAAPANAGEYEQEAVGYGQGAYPAWRNPVHARIGLAGDGYAGDGYDPPDGYHHYNDGYNGGAEYNNQYDGAPAASDWTPDAGGSDWQEWNDWQDWGPPPAMHPDHPSAPVSRIQLPPDHPSGQYWTPRAPSGPLRDDGGNGHAGPSQGPPRRRSVARDSDGPGSLPTYLAVVAEGQAHREVSRFEHEPRRGPQEAVGYQREPGLPRRDSGLHRRPAPGWEESTDFRRDTGPFGPAVPGRFQSDRSSDRDSAGSGGQVVALADGQAARTAQRAAADAAAIREAAERDAAATRDAAEREAAEMRTRLEAMLSELNRMSAYADSAGAASMLAPAPLAPPEARPAPARIGSAPPATRPAVPKTRPAGPGGRPAGPRTAPASQPREPGTRTTTPGTLPRTRPAGPARQTETPTKTGPTQGRQRRAMRVATAGTAALLSIAAIGSIAYTSMHGFSFFVFRESGQGETPGNFTDANFLAGQKECRVGGLPAPCPAPQHHDTAPKGRHHKTAGSN